MPKKRSKVGHRGFFIDGEPVSLQRMRGIVKEDTLQAKLGDYIAGAEVRKRTGINYATLQRWRHSGKLRAHKMGASWFYSRQDLLDLINSSER